MEPCGCAAAGEAVARVMLEGSGGLAGPREGRVYHAVLIRPGAWKGKGLWAGEAVLQRSAGLFNGLASFLNPPPPRQGQHGHPMLERLLGVTENARWDEAARAVVADYRLADTDAARWFGRLVDGWLAARAAGRPVPDVGLSAVPIVRVGPVRADGLREVVDILSVEHIDAVYRPAAGGEFVRVMNASLEGEFGMDADLRDTDLATDPGRIEVAAANGSAPTIMAAGNGGANHHSPTRAVADVGATPLRGAQAAGGSPLQADLAELAAMQAALREGVLEARLAGSGLPAGFQRVVREGLPAAWRVADLEGAIQRVKAAWADEESKRTVSGVRPVVSGMNDGLDQVTEALTALLEGRAPRTGVRPLSGIREAYLHLSGDYEMTGLFYGDRVQLANVTSTTMASITANVLNKIVVNEFQRYPKWWAPIVRAEAFTTLQTVRWITLGGVGELPTVAEGAAYTELTWDDSYETASWSKKGGYLGLTLEAMDKDDVGRLRSAPRALAQAAWLTLGKAVSAVFTANSGVGPTLQDTGALFNATAVATAGGHANLGTTALNTTSWPAAKLAMRKQVEVNSGERLGALTSPKYLLVPPDLENTALTVLASENMPGTANNDVNPEAEGNTFDARMNAARRRIIVVDLWTDTNNWAAVADPNLYPTIGVGYRYGETPEIFSVATPNSGLMFTNDVMPVKVRWFFAVGPMDFRGLYKANV